MLLTNMDRYAKFHGVTYDAGAAQAAVDMFTGVGGRDDMRLPRGAIYWMDAAGASVKLSLRGDPPELRVLRGQIRETNDALKAAVGDTEEAERLRDALEKTLTALTERFDELEPRVREEKEILTDARPRGRPARGGGGRSGARRGPDAGAQRGDRRAPAAAVEPPRRALLHDAGRRVRGVQGGRGRPRDRDRSRQPDQARRGLRPGRRAGGARLRADAGGEVGREAREARSREDARPGEARRCALLRRALGRRQDGAREGAGRRVLQRHVRDGAVQPDDGEARARDPEGRASRLRRARLRRRRPRGDHPQSSTRKAVACCSSTRSRSATPTSSR